MNNKRKIGILLFLIGIAIPLVLFFFQENDRIFFFWGTKNFTRKLTVGEINALEHITKLKALILQMNEEEKRVDLKSKGGVDKLAGLIVDGGILEEDLYRELIKVYGENHFKNETWQIQSTLTFDIPFRRIIGTGVLFVLLGMGFFIFSFSKKIQRKDTRHEIKTGKN